MASPSSPPAHAETLRKGAAEDRRTLAKTLTLVSAEDAAYVLARADAQDAGAVALNDLAPLREELETERIRLAACATAALGNTEAAKAERLTPDHPYWSASYGDVCAAVDREIALRARVAQLEQDRDTARGYLVVALRNGEVGAIKSALCVLGPTCPRCGMPSSQVDNYCEPCSTAVTKNARPAIAESGR